MKAKYIILLFILFSYEINAQEFKLGKVSLAELEQKIHPKDSSAVAAILFKKGNLRFDYSDLYGFKTITTVQTRIKIYKKEGYKWANQSIRYYIDNQSDETLTFSGAVTYNLVNGKIEKTKLKNDGEFIEKINKYWGQKKITMPNVKEGSVIEFEYEIISPRIGALRDWDFQTSIPVDYSEYTTNIPEYFEYKIFQKGFVFPKITFAQSTRKIDYIQSVDSNNGSPPTRIREALNFSENQTKYLVENLTAMKKESFVNNIDNYTASLSSELSLIHYPNTPIKNYSTDWESVVKTIYDYNSFGPELNKTGYFENDVKMIIAGLNKQDEKINAIFNYVKSNVKWNKNFAFYCADGVKKAYKDKVGNTAEINLMLTAMLRFAELDANPVLVSTRDNGITLFPSRVAFNCVIASVKISEGLILLDATSKFSAPDILPLRDLNWIGRLIRKDGTSEEVDLIPKRVSMDNVILYYAIDSKGKITRQRTAHNAMIFRSNYENINEEEYLEKLENEYKKIEISDYSRTNGKDIQLPILENYSFVGTNLCDVIGDKIYINPLLFFAEVQNPFKQETRTYPIDYGFSFQDKYIVNIDIPEGYIVETIPKSTKLSMQENIGGFRFIVNSTENKIQLSMSHQINTPIVSSEYYPMLKEYYQGMITKQTENIVIKKL